MDPITGIAIATALIKGSMDLWNYWSNVRAEMQRTGEWTQEMEDAWDKAQSERQNAYYYQPHPKQ